MYSQCIYKKPTETLEQAAVHKLETMYNGLKLKKGMRLLDIGGGWGGATRYCVPRGIDITSLTIAQKAVKLSPKIQQFIGIGNSTGLGMAPFLIKHPQVIDSWVRQREQALWEIIHNENLQDHIFHG